MSIKQRCTRCGKPLPIKWSEKNLFRWNTNVCRTQCKHCGKCLTKSESGFLSLGKCEKCEYKLRLQAEKTREERKAAKRIAREDKERIEREENERIEQQKIFALQRAKEAERAKYRQLREEIEAMPQYAYWRETVLEKFGRKCAVCDSVENIEVDHRYKSFYAIVQDKGITNTIQAYECAELWDVNNGAPLCKKHHNQTKSSVYRRNLSSQA